MSNRNMTRRNFLRQGTLGTSFMMTHGFSQMLAWIVDGMTKKAMAADSQPFNYVNIHCIGGPNRWGFDQWLKVRPSDSLVANPHVATAFSGGQTIYRTIDHGLVQLPHLFQFDVATGNGGRRPLKDILNHMAVIRGVTTRTDGHSSNHARQTQPIPGGVSLGGLFADAYARNIPSIATAIQQDAGIGYRSAKGRAQTKLRNPNALARELMSPFDASNYSLSSDFITRKSLHSKTLARAAAALFDLANANDATLGILKTNVTAALDQIAKGVGDLESFWPAAVARYSTAILNSVRPQILYPGGMAGITTDLATGASVVSDGTQRFQMNSTDSVSRTIDQGYSLGALVENSTITFLAQYFALIEFVLLNELSSSIELPIGFLDGLRAPVSGVTRNFGADGDEHGTGAGAALVLDAMFFRGVSSALLELTTTLKNKNLFQRTMIHLTGDFARSPKNGTSVHGSDHGFEACVSSLFSGVISGPVLVGNIAANSMASEYPGTWGQAARITELNGMAEPGHVAATIATLMGMQHPWNITPPLLGLSNGQVKAFVENPRIV